MVTDGKVTKDCGIRVLRKGRTVYVGVLSSLRRIKEAVKEVSIQKSLFPNFRFTFSLLTSEHNYMTEGSVIVLKYWNYNEINIEYSRVCWPLLLYFLNLLIFVVHL